MCFCKSAKSTFWWFAMGFAKCALCRVCLFTCLFLRIGPSACIFDSKLRHQLGMVQPLVWPPWFYFWKHYLVIQLISLCSVNLSDKSYSLSVPLIVVYSAQSFLLSSTVLCLLGFGGLLTICPLRQLSSLCPSVGFFEFRIHLGEGCSPYNFLY